MFKKNEAINKNAFIETIFDDDKINNIKTFKHQKPSLQKLKNHQSFTAYSTKLAIICHCKRYVHLKQNHKYNTPFPER